MRGVMMAAVCAALWIGGCMPDQTEEAQIGASTGMEKMMDRAINEGWEMNDPRDGGGESGSQRAIKGARLFHTARLQRDTTTGGGMSDDGTARQMQIGMSLVSMQGYETARKVVITMIQQNLREDIVRSGAELDYRLFRDKFDADRLRLVNSGYHQTVRIFDEVKERFEKGGGKVGGW